MFKNILTLMSVVFISHANATATAEPSFQEVFPPLMVQVRNHESPGETMYKQALETVAEYHGASSGLYASQLLHKRKREGTTATATLRREVAFANEQDQTTGAKYQYDAWHMLFNEIFNAQGDYLSEYDAYATRYENDAMNDAQRAAIREQDDAIMGFVAFKYLQDEAEDHKNKWTKIGKVMYDYLMTQNALSLSNTNADPQRISTYKAFSNEDFCFDFDDDYDVPIYSLMISGETSTPIPYEMMQIALIFDPNSIVASNSAESIYDINIQNIFYPFDDFEPTFALPVEFAKVLPNLEIFKLNRLPFNLTAEQMRSATQLRELSFDRVNHVSYTGGIVEDSILSGVNAESVYYSGGSVQPIISHAPDMPESFTEFELTEFFISAPYVFVEEVCKNYQYGKTSFNVMSRDASQSAKLMKLNPLQNKLEIKRFRDGHRIKLKLNSEEDAAEVLQAMAYAKAIATPESFVDAILGSAGSSSPKRHKGL